MNDSSSVIGVVGAGYVGLTSAVCFAELGHVVRVLDVDESRIGKLLAGRPPIFEEGLEELLIRHTKAGRLTASTSLTDVIPGCAYVFLCVPTPSAPDGSADLSFLRQASRDVAPYLDPGAIVVNKSTVPVGSTFTVRDELQRPDVTVASNPEFLREGTAIADFMTPDRVVVGSIDRSAAERVAELYAGVNETEFVITDPASAELIKYASNAYLATRLSFINAVAEVCEVLGGDIAEVSRAIGLDSRIGPKFLQPGPGWGGSCFPKDTKALASMAEAGGFEFKFLNSVIESNEEQFDLVANRALEMLGPDPSATRVAALGLAFKAGTDDVRCSPALEIINRLVSRGAEVVAYDPQARPDHDAIVQVDSALEAAKDSDLLLILTEWAEFADLDAQGMARAMRTAQVLDTRTMIDIDQFAGAGFNVRQVGRPLLMQLDTTLERATADQDSP